MTKFMLAFTALLMTMVLSQSAKAEVKTDQKQFTKLEGYIIGEPQFNKATKSWRFKLAPKRNKQLEGVYVMITVPATKGNLKPYYLGDYVKLQANYDLIRTAQAEAGSATLASEAAGS